MGRYFLFGKGGKICLQSYRLSIEFTTWTGLTVPRRMSALLRLASSGCSIRYQPQLLNDQCMFLFYCSLAHYGQAWLGMQGWHNGIYNCSNYWFKALHSLSFLPEMVPFSLTMITHLRNPPSSCLVRGGKNGIRKNHHLTWLHSIL